MGLCCDSNLLSYIIKVIRSLGLGFFQLTLFQLTSLNINGMEELVFSSTCSLTCLVNYKSLGNCNLMQLKRDIKEPLPKQSQICFSKVLRKSG